MPTTVTIFADTNTPLPAGVGLQLLDGTTVVDSAISGAGGIVTFGADLQGVASPAVNVDPNQPPQPPQ
jgi:hypothetical protein